MHKRYFANPYPDLEGKKPGEEAKVDSALVMSRIKELVAMIRVSQKKTSTIEDCAGGTYVGISGIAFMFWYLAQKKTLFEPNDTKEYLTEALLYIGPAIEFAEDIEKGDSLVDKFGFLLGNAGIYLVASLVYNGLGDIKKRDKYLDRYVKMAENCLPPLYLRKGADELLVGRAGYVCGALYLNKALETPVVPKETLESLGISTVDSGTQYGKRRGIVHQACPLMYSYYDTEYLGAAHGLSAIYQMLLQTPGFFTVRPQFEQLIKDSVDYVLSLQNESGNFPCATDELGPSARMEEDELVHWCHGAPGIIWLMAKASLLWGKDGKEPKYLESCLRIGDLIWKKGLLKKGPGICHGVAGNGYAFLLLYRLTGNVLHLNRANQFNNFMFTDEFKTEARKPDAPNSLFEGIAGTVCFLADLLDPDKAQFPLFVDIFDD